MQTSVLLFGLFLGLGYATLALGAGIKMPPGMELEVGKRSDVKYIKCGACEHLAKNAYRMARELRDELKPGKQLEEFVLIEKVEKLGNPNKDEGEWIAALDMVEDGKRIRLVEMDEIGKCGVECKTIQMAVDGILESADTDIAEKLWQGKTTRAQFQNWLCYEATNACSKKAPPLPADRPKGPEFVVADKKEREIQKMMAGMKDMGMGGTLYNRDQMMNQYKALGGDDLEDEDDDEGEEEQGSSFAEDPSGDEATVTSENPPQKKPKTLGERLNKMVNKIGLGGGGGDEL